MFAGAAALATTGGCSSANGVGPQTVGDVAAGNVSALPSGTLRAIGSSPVCVGRDAKGVYAMTLTCTHAGCNIATQGAVAASGIECGCHGSRFDADGNVTRGPAGAPLAHFEVSVDGQGNLTVHTGSEVDASTRLAV